MALPTKGSAIARCLLLRLSLAGVASCRLIRRTGWCRLVRAGAGVVVVVGVFGDEAADADVAEMVEVVAEFVDRVIELVGVLV